MPPKGYENRGKRIVFYDWVYEIQQSEKQVLTIKEKIKIANKKRIKAVKKENYLEAAKYRDIIENLKK